MSDLLSRAKEIKNATEIGENTAERVGGVMVDTVNEITSLQERAVLHEDSLTTHGKQITALQNKGQSMEYDIEQQQRVINSQGTRLTEVEHRADEHDTQIAKVQDEKAPKVGYAPDLKVNFAKELVGRGEATPQVIGKIRPTGEISIGDGNATIEKIKGDSVVWNQLAALYSNNAYVVNEGNTYNFTPNGNSANAGSGSYSSGWCYIANIKDVMVGHSYMVLMEYERIAKRTDIDDFSPSVVTVMFGNSYANYQVDFGKKIEIANIFTVSGGNDFHVSLNDCIVSISNPQIIDLTKMFGAGNEPTTIEEFEARRPLSVTDDYNEGEIISYDGANELKSVGFNAWDEEWEVGGFFEGVLQNDSNYNNTIRNKNFIRVISGGTYRFEYGGNVYINYFDRNKKYISAQVVFNNSSFTVPENAVYIWFRPEGNTYGVIYNHDICIHLVHSGYRNGEYKPYEADTLQLPGPKSIKDKDGNQLFPYGLLSAGSAHDEITATKAIKRMARLYLDGSEAWSLQSINDYGIANFSIINNGIATGYNAQSDRFNSQHSLIAETKDEGFLISTSYVYIRINSSKASTIEQFRQWLQNNPTTLIGELITPIEVDLEEPLNLTYEAWDFGTEELKTDAKTTPLNADISYQFNAVDRIRENTTKASDLEARIARLEAMLTQMAQANESNEMNV